MSGIHKHQAYRIAIVTAFLLSRSLPVLATPVVLAAPSTDRAAMSTSPAFSEYEIKAGFIYRFLFFVSWPEDLPESGSITIGILGRNPFGKAFRSIEGSTVADRVVKLRYFDHDADIGQLKTSQVLFISSSTDNDKQRDIITALGDSPTLTISDSKGFIDRGGMIGFIRKDDQRIGIELNVAAANRARLTIRSMLKRIAVRIINEPVSAKEARFAHIR